MIPRDWANQAACAGMNPRIFFPVKGGEGARQAVAAKAVCAKCPVTHECLEYCFELDVIYGVWGGTTEEERKLLRRTWRGVHQDRDERGRFIDAVQGKDK